MLDLDLGNVFMTFVKWTGKRNERLAARNFNDQYLIRSEEV